MPVKSAQREWFIREGFITNYSGNSAEIEVPNNINNHVITIIGPGAFSPLRKNLRGEVVASRKAIRTIRIANGIKGIRANAFEGCSALEIVEFPQSLQYISEKCFRKCESLREIDLSMARGVSIDSDAFAWCKSLKRVVLPEYINDMWTKAYRCFDHCTSLEYITMPDSMGKIPMMMFYGCNSLKEITLPRNIDKIDTDSFHGCSSLRAISIPATVKTIGVWAFIGCGMMEEIHFSEGLNLIESGAFKGCGVKRLELPESLKNIGVGAFENCRNLESVVLPSTLGISCESVFRNCPNLKNIVRR